MDRITSCLNWKVLIYFHFQLDIKRLHLYYFMAYNMSVVMIYTYRHLRKSHTVDICRYHNKMVCLYLTLLCYFQSLAVPADTGNYSCRFDNGAKPIKRQNTALTLNILGELLKNKANYIFKISGSLSNFALLSVLIMTTRMMICYLDIKVIFINCRFRGHTIYT